MRIRRIEVLRQLDVLVRAHAVRLPLLLARGEIVRRDPTANTKLTARHTDDELVFDNEARHGLRFAPRRVGVANLPYFLASFRIECDHLAVERGHEDSTLREIHPAVNEVAARDRNGAIVLHRRVFPLDWPAFLREVEGVHMVWIRAVHVHRRADDERLPFVAAQGARRERPDLPEILGIPRGNLLERAVARCGVVLSRQHPLIVVGLLCDELLVGRKHPRQPQHQSCDRVLAQLHGSSSGS